MRLRNCLLSLAAVALLSIGTLVIADEATTQPTATAAKPAPHVKLPKPFSQLTDLTDAQKSQMLAIHVQVLDQIKQINAKEHDDLMTLLTDDQKSELTAIAAKQAEERKAADEAKRSQAEAEKAAKDKQAAEGGATTQP